MQEVKEPIVVTEGEAARLLSVSRAALRRWRREGRGPEFTRLERCVRYDLRSIELFVTQNSSGNKRTVDSQPSPTAEGA
jgi:predicted site-specific integrase-resolvase